MKRTVFVLVCFGLLHFSPHPCTPGGSTNNSRASPWHSSHSATHDEESQKTSPHPSDQKTTVPLSQHDQSEGVTAARQKVKDTEHAGPVLSPVKDIHREEQALDHHLKNDDSETDPIQSYHTNGRTKPNRPMAVWNQTEGSWKENVSPFLVKTQDTSGALSRRPQNGSIKEDPGNGSIKEAQEKGPINEASGNTSIKETSGKGFIKEALAKGFIKEAPAKSFIKEASIHDYVKKHNENQAVLTDMKTDLGETHTAPQLHQKRQNEGGIVQHARKAENKGGIIHHVRKGQNEGGIVHHARKGQNEGGIVNHARKRQNEGGIVHHVRKGQNEGGIVHHARKGQNEGGIVHHARKGQNEGGIVQHARKRQNEGGIVHHARKGQNEGGIVHHARKGQNEGGIVHHARKGQNEGGIVHHARKGQNEGGIVHHARKGQNEGGIVHHARKGQNEREAVSASPTKDRFENNPVSEHTHTDENVPGYTPLQQDHEEVDAVALPLKKNQIKAGPVPQLGKTYGHGNGTALAPFGKEPSAMAAKEALNEADTNQNPREGRAIESSSAAQPPREKERTVVSEEGGNTLEAEAMLVDGKATPHTRAVYSLAVHRGERAAKGQSKNLAKGKHTNQSSTYPGADGYPIGHSRFAVDGNRTQAYKYGSCSHTYRENLPHWWRVDLGQSEKVAKVVIYNREDCCGERLHDFRVDVGVTGQKGKVDYQECYHYAGVAGSVVTITCSNVMRGRYVRIIKPEPNAYDYLTLCEVEVFGLGECRCTNCDDSTRVEGDFVNIVYNTPVSSSSSWRDKYKVCLLSDGYLHRNKEEYCMHTADTDVRPWVEIDLEDIYSIQDIKIIRRKLDRNDIHDLTRLYALQALVDGEICYTWPDYGELGALQELIRKTNDKYSCYHVLTGRYLRFEKRDVPNYYWNFHIVFCEIRVMVCKPNFFGHKTCHPCPADCKYVCNKRYGCDKLVPWNVAIKKKATQSSILWGNPNFAVDGSIAGKIPSRQCTATNPVKDGASRRWWQVDLGGWYKVFKVYVHNRVDRSGNLLKLFDVFVESKGMAEVSMPTQLCAKHRKSNLKNGAVIELPCNTSKQNEGQFVILLVPRLFTLQICEVRVIGHEITEMKAGRSCADRNEVRKCHRDLICVNDVCKCKYGPKCLEPCGHCADNKPCDSLTGHCLACLDGWKPPNCMTAVAALTPAEQIVVGITVAVLLLWLLLAVLYTLWLVLRNAGCCPCCCVGYKRREEEEDEEDPEVSSDTGPPSKWSRIRKFISCGGACVTFLGVLFCIPCCKLLSDKFRSRDKALQNAGNILELRSGDAMHSGTSESLFQTNVLGFWMSDGSEEKAKDKKKSNAKHTAKNQKKSDGNLLYVDPHHSHQLSHDQYMSLLFAVKKDVKDKTPQDAVDGNRLYADPHHSHYLSSDQYSSLLLAVNKDVNDETSQDAEHGPFDGNRLYVDQHHSHHLSSDQYSSLLIAVNKDIESERAKDIETILENDPPF